VILADTAIPSSDERPIMLNRHRQYRCVLLLSLGLTGCGSATTSEQSALHADSRSSVVVTACYPLYMMADALAASAVDVEYAVPDGRTSRTWDPSPEDVQKLQTAGVILLNGAGYEPWAQRLSLPRSRTVDTSSGYRARLLRVADDVTHQHGPVGQQSNRDAIPTTWLEPELASAQLGRVEEQLVRMVPDAADAVSQRATAIRNGLKQLGRKMAQLRAETSAREVTVATDEPDFQYLTSGLGWKMHQIQWASNDILTPESVAAFTEHSVQLIMIRPDGNQTRIEQLRALDIPCVAVDTCEFALRDADTADSLVSRLSANLDLFCTELGL
jgi:zinc transport system substrate-binding protein